jgi:glutamine phosphoribosylpyrophosphate amidotransferase
LCHEHKKRANDQSDSINEEDIFNAMSRLYTQCRGGYACIAMIAGFGLVAFRVTASPCPSTAMLCILLQ